MDVFLMRHGEADDIGGKIKSDFDRPLTKDGIAIMEDEAEGMKKLGLRFNVILSSPLIRAKETAQIIAESLGYSRKITICDALGIPSSTVDLMTHFKEFQNDYKILLVGHMPGIGKLAGFFTGQKIELSFKKGSMCKIEVEQLVPTVRGDIKWLLTPRQLKLIGQA